MKRETIFLSLWILGGVILTAGGLISLRSSDGLATDRNPFAIQRSAYGKLLARLSETTVDRVWHMGVEQVAPHKHDVDDEHSHDHHDHGGHAHECGPECSHSHGVETAGHGYEEHEHTHPAFGDEPALTHSHPHDHDDAHFHGDEVAFADHGHDHPASGEADVFEYNVADGDNALTVSDEDRVAQDEGYHCAMCKEAKLAQKGVDFTTDAPIVPQAKEFLGHLSALKLVRTNPKSMSKAHVNWAKKQVESQLLRSYKMDPTHYGVYNSYHLFLTTHDFGGTEATRKHAQVIAQHTIANVLQENEDPEPWLTAAAAAMNLYLLKSEPYTTAGEQVPVELMKEYQANIAHCLARFSELQKKSEEAGVWGNLSQERQLEIAERHRFAMRTHEPFEAMIARAEARLSTPSEGEVAENSEENED